MNEQHVANSGLLFLLCGIVVAFVLYQAFAFIRRAWRRGLELKMQPETMKRVMKSSVIFSIIPSLPILIILLVLMPNLGRYFPWLRLSVVGSGVYENMAADITAKAHGLTGIADPGFDTVTFVSAMWVMTIGIIWGPLYCAFGAKHIQKGMNFLKSKENINFNAIFGAMFLALLFVLSGTYLAGPFKLGETGLTGLVPLLVMITSGLCIWFFDLLAKKYKSRVWTEFSFPLSLVIGMLSATVYNAILS